MIWVLPGVFWVMGAFNGWAAFRGWQHSEHHWWIAGLIAVGLILLGVQTLVANRRRLAPRVTHFDDL